MAEFKFSQGIIHFFFNFNLLTMKTKLKTSDILEFSYRKGNNANKIKLITGRSLIASIAILK